MFMFTPLSHLPSARSSVASASKYREDRAATASMLMSVSVSLKSSDEGVRNFRSCLATGTGPCTARRRHRQLSRKSR